MSETHLEFTGERFTPECVREIWYEHVHRYAFARRLAAGRDVLDVACGEGYGSAMLADVAASVLGLDISEAAVAHAQRRYADKKTVRYAQGDATRLASLVPAHCVDLAVSFETIEHVAAQEDLLDGLVHALRPEGVLLISSPDKATYSDATGFRNEFHVKELYRDEFVALLAARFRHVRLYGQKLLFQSALWSLDGSLQPAAAATAHADGKDWQAGLAYAPLYFVAACSNRPLPTTLPGLDLFGDREESVYGHYNHEIRKNIAAGGRIAELEAEVARLQAELASLRQR